MKQTIFVLLCLLCTAFSLTFPVTRIPHPLNLKRAASNVQTDSLDYYRANLQDGEYYITIWLGTPAKPFVVQIDTASADLIIYSDDCSGCHQTGDRFVQFDYLADGYPGTKSTSFNYLPCQGSTCNIYGGCTFISTDAGSKHRANATSSQIFVCNFGAVLNTVSGVSGIVGTDLFRFEETGLSVDNVAFGLARLFQGGNHDTPFSGIFGLGYSAHSFKAVNALDTIIPKFQQQDSSFKNAFSLCLPNSIDFGNDYSDDLSVEWTPSATSSGAASTYTVTISNMKLKFNKTIGASDGVSVHRNNTVLTTQSINMVLPTVVDSGMKSIALTENLLEGIKYTIIKSGISLHGVTDVAQGHTIFDGDCYALTASDIDRYPDLNIYFDQMDDPITVPSSNWLLTDDNTNYCSAVVATPKNHGNILGTTFIQLSRVIFDRAGQRIGFGTCPV